MGKKFKCFLLATLMLFSGTIVFAQNNSTNSGVNSETAENQISLQESTIYLDSADNSETGNYSTSSGSWFFIKMVLVLILVVVAIYFILKFFKNKTNPTVEDSDFLRKVASLNIAPGRTVEIVTLLDQKGYILGVTESNISLLAEIGKSEDEKELISAMNLEADKNQKSNKPSNFSDVLEMFVGRGKSSKTNISNIYEESAQKVDEFVNSNSSRLDSE